MQREVALRSGPGLRFVWEHEQGKETVRMDKANIDLLNAEAAPRRKEMNVPRTAYVYVRKESAGTLSETDNGYSFQYDAEYINEREAAVSPALPFCP